LQSGMLQLKKILQSQRCLQLNICSQIFAVKIFFSQNVAARMFFS
jgi:hypothetical protein